MLKKSKSALLISANEDFASRYEALAKSVRVILYIETEWNTRYRVKDDVVILGGKHLDNLNEAYYDKAVVILNEGESTAPYIQRGIQHFIFNYQNKFELITALFYQEPVVVRAQNMKVEEIIKEKGVNRFVQKDYDFRFDKDVFMYKGRQIYIRRGEQKFLADWLLMGHKDNKRRTLLYNLRDRFGKDFLADIDRFGRIKEERNEQ